MLALLPYIEKAVLLANLTSSGYGSRNTCREMTFFWIVIGLSVVSYLLIVAGLAFYLIAHYELPIALIVTGLVILFTVLLTLAVTRIYKKVRNRKIERTIKAATNDVSHVVSALGNEISGTFKNNAGIATALVAAIGFLTARKII